MAQQWTSRELRTLLFRELEKQPGLRRKQLIERCVRQLALPPEELENRSPNAQVVWLKSRLGQQLTALQLNDDITESEAGFLTTRQSEGSVLAREDAAQRVLTLLSNGRAWSARQIYEQLGKELLPADKAARDALHSLLGQTIAALVREKRLYQTDGGYVCSACSGYPNTELGNWLAEARRGGDLCRCFLGATHTKGGEWLEIYAVELMQRYYSKLGKTVSEASVTGGSDDGGLDGIVRTTDALGFREVTLLQMKNRRAEVCARDVREFYGAVCAYQGTRGIFVTVSTFHYEAQKLLQQVPNLIGIDGKMLFSLAAFCGYGVLNGGEALDDALFLGEKDE